MKTLYFDYAASTPVDHRVVEKMLNVLQDKNLSANPTSLHYLGKKAKDVIEDARFKVATLINAKPEEIIFTSGATESDNLAIKGAAHLYRNKGQHIVTLASEHKAVLDTCQQLEKEGYQVTYLKPLTNGLLDIDQCIHALRNDTILVSIMQVNNETGVIQDINQIANITQQRNILLHVDAAQSAGKIIIDVQQTPIDLLSLSSHKLYGPKGIGALYLRKKPRVRVEPLIHGGGHERGMRSGTLATHQIVGMGEAFHLAHQLMDEETESIKQLRQYFLYKLEKQIILNVDAVHTVPHIISVRFPGMIANAILADMPQVAASTASACLSQGEEGSYVLRAMGFSQEVIQSSVRFSLGRYSLKQEIDELAAALSKK